MRTDWILLVVGLAAISTAGSQQMGGRFEFQGMRTEPVTASVDGQSTNIHTVRYPYRAKEIFVEGTVVMLVLVSPRGVPIAAGVEETSGSEILDNSAVNAVASWSFHPLVLDGVASFEWFRTPVVFQLEKTIAAPPAVPLPEGSVRARWVNKSALTTVTHAADAGDRMALEVLGDALEKGIVLPPDEARANELFAKGRSAAEKAVLDGDPKAAVEVADYYSSGKGVPRDLLQAEKWIRVAAIGGDAWGQATLGRMYSTGEGISKDAVLAYAWTSVSRRGQTGYAEIVDLDGLGASLSVEQLAQARALSSRWKPGEDMK